MEQWIPLMVAAVGAIAAIGVAFWNTRGETVELRQLKAMNEALSSLSAASDELKTFTLARDALAVRIAVRVLMAPKRRRTGWFITSSIFILAFAAGFAWLFVSLSGETDANVTTWLAPAVSLIGGISGLVISIRGWREATQDARLKAAGREARLLLSSALRAGTRS